MWSSIAELPAILLASLVYLLFDTYPVVKSFRATFRAPSLFLLWVIMATLNLIAFGLLRVSARATVAGLVESPALTTLTLVFLATIGTIGIVQSLTMKIADHRFLDVSKLIDGFRAIVLADISRIAADLERLRAMSVARALSQKLDAAQRRREYASVMTFTGRPRSDVEAELQLLIDPRALAERIALADVGYAERLLRFAD